MRQKRFTIVYAKRVHQTMLLENKEYNSAQHKERMSSLISFHPVQNDLEESVPCSTRVLRVYLVIFADLKFYTFDKLLSKEIKTLNTQATSGENSYLLFNNTIHLLTLHVQFIACRHFVTIPFSKVLIRHIILTALRSIHIWKGYIRVAKFQLQ